MNDAILGDLRPTRIRFGVLGFACSLSMITYLDRVCFGTVAPYIQKEFNLDETQKGMLFTAFVFAYAAFEVPAGWLGDVFGPRKTLIRIVIWWSFFTVLTGLMHPHATWPLLAFWGLVAVRFLFGVGEAGAYPNIAKAFHNWFPFGERGFAQGAVWMAGRLAGGLTPLIVLALIREESSATGEKTVHWRHAFWIFGGVGMIWCVFFWYWFRDRPDQKASVNAAELALIREGEGPSTAGHHAVPWRQILTNRNLWILCGMYACAAYGWYFNITWLPGYLDTQFHVNKDSVGFWPFSFMAGAPLLFGSVACLVGGMMTDAFIRRTGDRKWGRRLFGVVGHGICGVCYFLSILATNEWFFVLAIAMAAFWNDMTMGSAWASCIDIGKRYSGIVSGCMNTVGNMGAAGAALMTGWILDWYNLPKTDPDAPLAQLAVSLSAYIPTGWTLNFLMYTTAYAVATFLWLQFDSTKPVVAEPETLAA